MLTSQQIDTLSGIVENYDHYVVYYYADYHDYQSWEVRDSRIDIYVGSDISFSNNTFIFGEDVSYYRLTNSKYISSFSCGSSFSVPASELVYTDLAASYPSLCFFQTEYNNFDFNSLLVCALLILIAFPVVLRVIFGGK